jgi:hypothetical protein
MATKITEVGLRATLQRMMARIINKRSHPLFIFRTDGRTIRVTITARTSFIYEPGDETFFDVRASWHDAYGYDSAFVAAMNMFYDTEISHINLAQVSASLCFSKTGLDAVPTILSKLLQVVSLELCTCEKCVIPDGEVVCYTCALGVREEDVNRHMCGICYEICVAPVTKQTCCGQYIHSACKAKCMGLVCPFCRAAE